ncbi:MAG TPA: hemerythrin domain-containing protein [Acidobacteriaceae bacterium]
MAVQIGAKLDAGFDDPVGMLKDCHRRIENFLRVLCQVAQHRPEGALSAEERNAVEAALAYFQTGGQRHNQDEEESLFPRLRETLGRAELEAIHELETEHGEAGKLHALVEGIYSGWMASGSLSSEDRQALLAATDRLQRLYAGHIQIEERVVFPRAAAVLDAKAIAAIGSEFRARRTQPQH